MSGEEATFTRAEMDAMLTLAEEGIRSLITLQQEALS
jgi:ribonuclease PH